MSLPKAVGHIEIAHYIIMHDLSVAPAFRNMVATSRVLYFLANINGVHP